MGTQISSLLLFLALETSKQKLSNQDQEICVPILKIVFW
jgi:hypothetical protein